MLDNTVHIHINNTSVDHQHSKAGDLPNELAFKHAVEQGDVETLQALVAEAHTQISLINITDIYGRTALMIAAEDEDLTAEEYLQLLQGLIDAKADLNMGDKQNKTALMYAVEAGRLEAVQLLIQNGVDIKACNTDGMTALMRSVQLGLIEITQTLIEATKQNNTFIHAQDHQGRTALMLAAENTCMTETQQLAMLQILMNANKDKGAGGSNNIVLDSALLPAIKLRRLNVIRALMQGGTSIKIGNKSATEAENMNLITMLNAVADIEMPDKNGDTLLMRAVRAQRIDLVRALIKKGAQINAINKEGYIPLAYALSVMGPQSQMADVLRELGANQAYAKEFLETKWLAHVWGIGNQTTLKKTTFALEGMHRHYAIRKLSEYVEDFFNSNEFVNNSISKENQLEIKEAILNTFPQQPTLYYEKVIERIQLNKPFILIGGTEDHAISIVLFKNELIVCNRGDGSQENTTIRYALPVFRVTQEILKKLTFIYPNTQSFNQMIDDLNLPIVGAFKQKKQKVGNCTWASTKGAFGILCRMYADPNWGTPEEGKQAAEQGKTIYKKFTSYARIKAFKQSNYPDDIIKEIKNKNKLQNFLEFPSKRTFSSSIKHFLSRNTNKT